MYPSFRLRGITSPSTNVTSETYLNWNNPLMLFVGKRQVLVGEPQILVIEPQVLWAALIVVTIKAAHKNLKPSFLTCELSNVLKGIRQNSLTNMFCFTMQAKLDKSNEPRRIFLLLECVTDIIKSGGKVIWVYFSNSDCVVLGICFIKGLITRSEDTSRFQQILGSDLTSLEIWGIWYTTIDCHQQQIIISGSGVNKVRKLSVDFLKAKKQVKHRVGKHILTKLDELDFFWCFITECLQIRNHGFSEFP